jgi:hypothetical protein
MAIDLARYYANLGIETAFRGGAVVSAELVFKTTEEGAQPSEKLRLRADGSLLRPGGVALNWPTASGTIARLEDIVMGGGGESSAFQQSFTSVASVTCEHNFGAYPLVQVLDADLKQFIPFEIQHDSINQFTITFSSARTGTVLANYGGGSGEGGGGDGILSLTTDDVPEGASNLYYTGERFDLDFAHKSTDDLAEGSNLYYTDARVSALVTKAFVDALNVDADTLDGIDSLGFALASHVHAWADITSGLPTTLAGYGITDASPIFTDSAGLRGLLGDESGTGAALFANGNIGAATGTSLDLATTGTGDIHLAALRRVYFGGVSSGYWITQNSFGGLSIGTGAFTTLNNTFGLWAFGAPPAPATAGSVALGTITRGFGSLYLNEAGGGTQSAQIIAPTLASDIVLTTPAATGTLATLAGTESLTNKKLGSLTTNGFVKTGSGDGTLSVDTANYVPFYKAEITFLDGNKNGNFDNTLSEVFPSAQDTFPADAGTVYNFDSVVVVRKTGGTTAKHIDLELTWSGSGTLVPAIFYQTTQGSASSEHTNFEGGWLAVATGRVSPSTNTANEYFIIHMRGTITTPGAFSGNITPKMKWSATPGDGSTNGRMIFQIGSYFRMWKGAGSGWN